MRDVGGLRASGLGPVVEGIYQGGLDVGYHFLRWPIPRNPPRGLMLALMDVCTLGALVMGPLLHFAILSSWAARRPDPLMRHLVCALIPPVVAMLVNAVVLRGILASRLRQEGSR